MSSSLNDHLTTHLMMHISEKLHKWLLEKVVKKVATRLISLADRAGLVEECLTVEFGGRLCHPLRPLDVGED